MRMFSIAKRSRNNAGMSLAVRMERATASVQPIEFEPNKCALLRRMCGDEFSKELV